MELFRIGLEDVLMSGIGLPWRPTCPKCGVRVDAEIYDKHVKYCKGKEIDPKPMELQSNNTEINSRGVSVK